MKGTSQIKKKKRNRKDTTLLSSKFLLKCHSAGRHQHLLDPTAGTRIPNHSLSRCISPCFINCLVHLEAKTPREGCVHSACFCEGLTVGLWVLLYYKY